jgi:hypothetical protein
MFKCFRASSILLASALAASGCASIPPLLVDQPIGPLYPVATRSNHGTLVVYSETRMFSGDPDYLVHTGYAILTPEGGLIQQVDNHGNVLSREPTEVSLPAGRYKVLARESRHGTVSLTAVIQVGLRTVIDLNREVLPERTDKSEGWVRLSTGQIVGSKSE